ncbi:MAG TPA: malate dehydrogenase, partial [Piscirickettsiaceae bacterium]|nr:malate dehydrogenase [Piscirickettsiaceae bacterium]
MDDILSQDEVDALLRGMDEGEVTGVGGMPLTQILSKEDIADVVDKTKNGGAEIVK